MTAGEMIAMIEQQNQAIKKHQQKQEQLLTEVQTRDVLLHQQHSMLVQAQALVQNTNTKTPKIQMAKTFSEGGGAAWTWRAGEGAGASSSNGLIPRIIHQTGPTDLLAMRYLPLVRSWIVNNPGWQYRYWTDEDNR